MSEIAFKMPKMGESITEGTIINWLVQEGESFEEGDILCEVATDKVDNEIPAPAAGTMRQHKFGPKAVVPVGEVIAILEMSDKSADSTQTNSLPLGEMSEGQRGNSSKEPSIKTKDLPKKKKEVNMRSLPSKENNENVFISPLVDAVARKHHISYEELARITGSGKEGRLRKSDVTNYLNEGRPFQFAQAVAKPSGFQIPDLKFDKGKGKIVEMDRMRQMIADHMVFSATTAPHVTAYVEADLTKMVQWRNANKVAFQKKNNEKLTFTPLFIEAVAKAVKDFPMINSSLDGTNIIVKKDINIGMATALPSGNLIVPVVHNADKKNLLELAVKTNELVGKARDNKLKADDTKGSTFTISNVGTFGSIMGTPIINQPEAAILATGIIKKRAEVIEKPEGDTIEIRSMMYLSLSFDHRIVDGYLAGSFLRRIADNMEQFDFKRKY
ncbi:2-oxoglutarate dehydrogenase E2 component (dihydrolipoamide succinyltransferase) [Ulvibacter antarcticus]|uniref:Dihydrolipoamide acetyltransferase component of pyruvate dehydrogenase complex n=2 Tax=Ulvibacter antarcticus TaxID=442714 RepID=A0A3L9YAB5_9FLAO|nr:dihydrolipoamide acetyltransferase family protein [Ulvibacter antarcticus]RMA57653.1 2-oxoglutarate dehydrogenase E2 component (dihydrolipoamide succinyltransferase) [Ulvibacter antarcticus]